MTHKTREEIAELTPAEIQQLDRLAARRTRRSTDLKLLASRAYMTLREFAFPGVAERLERWVAALRAANQACDGSPAALARHAGDIQPVHVAAYIEQFGREMSPPTVKQHLACIRMMFDWQGMGQVMPSNPAHSVRGPRHSVSKGVTPELSSEEATALLAGVDVSTVVGMRDRAVIAVTTYTFARVSARSSISQSRITTRRRNASGPACARKTASSTKCPVYHKLKPISMRISARVSATFARGRCFDRRSEKPALLLASAGHARMSGRLSSAY